MKNHDTCTHSADLLCTSHHYVHICKCAKYLFSMADMSADIWRYHLSACWSSCLTRRALVWWLLISSAPTSAFTAPHNAVNIWRTSSPVCACVDTGGLTHNQHRVVLSKVFRQLEYTRLYRDLYSLFVHSHTPLNTRGVLLFFFLLTCKGVLI